MCEWNCAKSSPPSKEDIEKSKHFEFLCSTLTPGIGGRAVQHTKILKYNIHDKCWYCDGEIVTHWMPLPPPPEGD